MRAAHSIKGAARVVGVDPAVRVAHVMEDCFVAAQKGAIELSPGDVDVLLRGVDLLGKISAATRDPNADLAQSSAVACKSSSPSCEAVLSREGEVRRRPDRRVAGRPLSRHRRHEAPVGSGGAPAAPVPTSTTPSDVDDLVSGNPGFGGRRGDPQTVAGRDRLAVRDDPIRPAGDQGPGCPGLGASGCGPAASRQSTAVRRWNWRGCPPRWRRCSVSRGWVSRSAFAVARRERPSERWKPVPTSS